MTVDKMDTFFEDNQDANEIKEYLENIIDLMPGHVYWKDTNGFYLGCNDLQAKDAGLSGRHEIVGKTDYDMPWKEQADILRRFDREIIESGIAKTVEEPSTLADGTDAIFLSKKVPLFLKNKIVGIVGISFDVTEKKRLDLELHDTQTKLENVINAIPGHVYWKDKNGVLLGCNDTQAKSIGLLSRHDVVGLTAFDTLPRDIAEEITQNDKRVIETGAAITTEEPFILPTGERSVCLSYKVPLYDNAGKVNGLLGISFDITEQKRTEQELRETRQKLEGMTLVSSSIAHELRTPLAMLNLAINNLKEFFPKLIETYQISEKANLPIPKIRARNLDLLETVFTSMESEVKASFTTIDMLLMNVKPTIEQGQAELFSIVGCVEMALARYPFQESQKKLIHFDKKDDFIVKAKDLLILHVLFNLLKNALYYIAKAHKGEIFIWLEQAKLYNKLYFKDTGTGIAKDVLNHIFDRFFTQTDHGAGIGLTFCRMVMESLGGEVTCESEEGSYTQFILSFPQIAE